MGKTQPRWGTALRVGLGLTALLVVLAMFPYTPDPTGEIKRLVLAIAAFLVACLYAFDSEPRGNDVSGPRPLLPLILAFTGLQAAAAAASSYPANSFVTVGRYVALAVLYAVAGHAFQSVSQVRRFFAVVCVATAAASVYGLCQRVGWDPFPWAEAQRQLEEYRNLPATFGNPNLAGHVLVLSIVLACYLGTHRGTRWCLGLVPLFLAHLYLTHERAGRLALLGAGAMLLVAGALSRVGREHAVRAVAMTWAATALIGAAGVAAVLAMTYARTGFAVPRDQSLILRYNSVQSASHMITERPWLGWGPGNYVIENTSFWTPFEQAWYAAEHELDYHVHCDVLESGVEAGVPGAALYLALLLGAASYCLLVAYSGQTADARRIGYFGAAFFTAFLVDGLFGFNLRVPVSGMLLFTVLGAVEGGMRTVNPRFFAASSARGRPAARLAVASLAALALALEFLQFGSHMLLARGRGAIAGKAFPAAAGLFARGERLAPWDWTFPFEQGLVAQSQGDIEGALAHYTRTLERNPYYVPARVGLASIEIERATRPISESEKALAEDKALGYAARVTELCPPSPEAFDVRGRVYSARAKRAGEKNDTARAAELWRLAAESFRHVLANAGKPPDLTYERLAEACQGAEDFASAETAWMRAVNEEPEDDGHWDRFTEFARRTDRYDELRYALARHTALSYGAQLNAPTPERERQYISLRRRMGEVLEEGFGDPDAAEHLYRSAVSRAPLQADAWDAFARFARSHGREPVFQKILRQTLESLQRKGTNAPPALIAARQLWDGGPTAVEQAVATLARAVQTALPGDWPPRVSLGWAADLVADQVRGTMATAPAADIANLGSVYARMERWTEAEALFAASFDRLPEPDQAILLPAYCGVLERTKAHDKALAMLRDARKRYPDSLDLSWLFARTLTAAGHTAEARVQYRLMLQRGVSDDTVRRAFESELAALENSS